MLLPQSRWVLGCYRSSGRSPPSELMGKNWFASYTLHFMGFLQPNFELIEKLLSGPPSLHKLLLLRLKLPASWMNTLQRFTFMISEDGCYCSLSRVAVIAGIHVTFNPSW
ncbi:hypothetical protein PIB30_075257 [Stylosanthes scabra]|uniref:Uncharacterized protein n=1 Tax=Stylosanthes scabra TaxID=79078 RepID=A0ABU6ZNU4_9FABA|nr:hypothetical protein [Stylosanthes scabra]